MMLDFHPVRFGYEVTTVTVSSLVCGGDVFSVVGLCVIDISFLGGRTLMFSVDVEIKLLLVLRLFCGGLDLNLFATHSLTEAWGIELLGPPNLN